MEKIKIILIEDHRLVREAWKASLLNQDNFAIVAEEETVTEAVQTIKITRHDIIIVDINLKGESGVDLILKVLNFLAKPKIIVVSMMAEYSFVKKMLSIGVKGYVTKNASITELIEAINKVYEGGTYLSSELNDLFVNAVINESKSVILTNGEIAVIREICKGKSNTEISSALKIKTKTVEGYKTKIFKKLKVSNVIGIIKYSQENGLTI